MTISKVQKKQAIDYLQSQVSLEALRQVYSHRDDSPWFRDQHFGLGLWVRNTLRAGGFKWDALTLDGEWAALITAAAKRLVEDQA